MSLSKPSKAFCTDINVSYEPDHRILFQNDGTKVDWQLLHILGPGSLISLSCLT